jgi:hypothetical protein
VAVSHGARAGLVGGDVGENAHERRAVPRIAVVLALELINEPIYFRFGNIAILSGHVSFS